MAAILTAGLAGTLFAGLLGVGTAEEEGASAIPHEEEMADDSEAPPDVPDKDKRFLIVGRVVDPAGQAVEGAEVLAVSATGRLAAGTRSDADGGFEIRFTRSSVDSPPGTRDWRHGCLVARHRGYGPGWIRVGELEAQPEPVLRLAEDVPIRGRILDLEGRPVAGATLEVIDIHGSDEQNLDGYLEAVRDQPTRAWLHARDHLRQLSAATLQLSAEAVPGTEPEEPGLRTDDEGRFELGGIGRERAVRFNLTGPNIESTLLMAITRPEIEPKWKREHLSREARMYHETGEPLPVVYAATFEHFAGPSRPISGTVRDGETGRPLAGVMVGGWMQGRNNSANTHTDEDGQYDLHGLAVEGTLHLGVRPPEGMPHLPAEREIRIAATSPAGKIDFELTGGVVVRGRCVEAVTGAPVDGQIQYCAFPENASAQELSSTLDTPWTNTIDGRFEITVVPGPGFLAAVASDDRYMAATADDFGRPASRPSEGRFATINRGFVLPDEFHVVKPIDASPGDEPLEVELRFHSGKKVAGKLVDPAGRPVTGATARGLGPVSVSTTLDGAEFTVAGMRADEMRTVVFRHENRKLGAIVRFTGAEHEPAVVTLRPLATLTGRIIDAPGHPVPEVRLSAYSEGAGQWFRQQRMEQTPDGEQPVNLGTYEPNTTEADGRFRVTALIPGVWGELLATPPEALERSTAHPVVARFALRAGETRGLGELALADLKAEPADGSAEAAAEPTPNVSSTSGPPAEERGRTLRGRVVDPGGKPVGGAKVMVWHDADQNGAISGLDGEFSIALTPAAAAKVEVVVTAEADGFGMGWTLAGTGEEIGVIKLPPVVPITGRIVDLEGRPVVGTSITVQHVFMPQKSLDDWLDAARRGEPPWVAEQALGSPIPHRPMETVEVQTDANGRFRIDGIGSERLVHASIHGPTVAYVDFRSVTRPLEPINWQFGHGFRDSMQIYGNDFTLAVSPSRPIRGIVRDATSGEPLAGVGIHSWRFASSDVGGRQ